MSGFSFARLFAMLRKESLQMRRDRGTVGLTVMLPLIQLFLFGYAINANPRHLPTGLITAEHSTYERTLVAALQNTGYFDIRPIATESEAEQALARGDVLFVLNIPPDFSRRIDRGERPQVLMDADATDPTAIGNATAAMVALNATVLNRDLPVGMQVEPPQPPFQVVLHARYNPEQITALNIVPGLIGLILTISTLVMTIARDHARTRAGHDGESAGNAGAASGGDAGQDHPLCRPGLRTNAADPCRVGHRVRGAGTWFGAVAAVRARRVHRVQPGNGVRLLHDGEDADAGSAIGAVRVAAVDDAVRLHVPVPGHAGLGARRRRGGTVDPRAADLPRHAAERQRAAQIWPDLWPMALFALVVGTIAVSMYRETLD